MENLNINTNALNIWMCLQITLNSDIEWIRVPLQGNLICVTQKFKILSESRTNVSLKKTINAIKDKLQLIMAIYDTQR